MLRISYAPITSNVIIQSGRSREKNPLEVKLESSMCKLLPRPIHPQNYINVRTYAKPTPNINQFPLAQRNLFVAQLVAQVFDAKTSLFDAKTNLDISSKFVSPDISNKDSLRSRVDDDTLYVRRVNNCLRGEHEINQIDASVEVRQLYAFSSSIQNWNNPNLKRFNLPIPDY